MTEYPTPPPKPPFELPEPPISPDDTQPHHAVSLDDTQPVRVRSSRWRGWLWLIGLSVVLMIAGAVFLLRNGSDDSQTEIALVPVVIQTNSGRYTVETNAQTVGDVLQAEQIILGEDDLVSPSLDTPVEVGLVIEIRQPQTVALTIDDQTQMIETLQTRPQDVLTEAGIEIGAADRVFLDGRQVDSDALESVTRPALNIVIRRGFLVTIVDDETERQLATQGPTVGDALFDAGIELYLADTITPELSTALAQGMTITITRSRPLTIIVDGERIETRTSATTVGEAVSEAGIVLSGLDYTAPDMGMPLIANTSVRVIRVTEELVTEQEIIEHGTQYQADAELALDSRRVLQVGQDGIIRRAVRVRYENGIEIERRVETEEQIQETQDEVIGYGTNVVIRTLNTPNGPVEYWRKLRVYATSYHPAALGGDDVTATGMRLRTGVVSIDPDIVSYRTQVYVEGYGIGIAADTGAPRRNPYWVDLGYSDDEYKGWHWWVDMYLLTPVPANIAYLLPLRAEGGPVP